MSGALRRPPPRGRPLAPRPCILPRRVTWCCLLVPGLPGLERLVRPPAHLSRTGTRGHLSASLTHGYTRSGLCVSHARVHEVTFRTSWAWLCRVPGHLLMQEEAGGGVSHERDPMPGRVVGVTGGGRVGIPGGQPELA